MPRSHLWDSRVSRAVTSQNTKLDEFLTISEKQLLHLPGTVSAKQAEKKALEEFAKYRKHQDRNYVSDFDRELKKILEMEKKRGKK